MVRISLGFLISGKQIAALLWDVVGIFFFECLRRSLFLVKIMVGCDASSLIDLVPTRFHEILARCTFVLILVGGILLRGEFFKKFFHQINHHINFLLLLCFSFTADVKLWNLGHLTDVRFGEVVVGYVEPGLVSIKYICVLIFNRICIIKYLIFDLFFAFLVLNLFLVVTQKIEDICFNLAYFLMESIDLLVIFISLISFLFLGRVKLVALITCIFNDILAVIEIIAEGILEWIFNFWARKISHIILWFTHMRYLI